MSDSSPSPSTAPAPGEEQPSPFIERRSGELITARDWNEMQRQVRLLLMSHTHVGGHHGPPLSGLAVGEKAQLAVASVSTSGDVRVQGDLRVQGTVFLGALTLTDALAELERELGRLAEGLGDLQSHLPTGGDESTRAPVGSRLQVVASIGSTQHLGELRCLLGQPGMLAVAQGFWEPGDGGGGIFVWSDVPQPEDGGLHLIPGDGASLEQTGRENLQESPTGAPGWQRLIQGPLNVRWFGARGDGASDDTPALRRALVAAQAHGSLHFPRGVYRVQETLVLPAGPLQIRGDGAATPFASGSPGSESPGIEYSRSGSSGSVLHFVGQDGAILQSPTTGAGPLTLEHLSLRGPGAQTNSIGIHLGEAAEGEPAPGGACRVWNVQLVDLGIGLDLGAACDGTYYSLQTLRCGVGIRAQKPVTGHLLIDWRAEGCQTAAALHAQAEVQRLGERLRNNQANVLELSAQKDEGESP